MAPTDAATPDMGPGEGPLQFGRREGGRDYPDRPAAFAVIVRDGRVALAHITLPGLTPYLDLPGGGIEPGETPEAAMAREVGEEVGLVVSPVRVLIRAGQFLIKRDDAPANNRLTVFEAEIVGEDARLKIEGDHELAWLEPLDAIAHLRLESHAVAVCAWLRGRRDPSPSQR